jgi:four helix bundle protein
MNLVQDKSYVFSVRLLNLQKEMINNHKDLTLFRQLLRSGTSVGANITEAQGAQSQKDFILKMSIAQKEAKETKYWIRLFTETGFIERKPGDEMLNDIILIDKILSKILIAAKKNLNGRDL